MSREFIGYASLFGVVDDSGDVIERGAFAASLRRTKAKGLRMLFQHDPAEPIGVWLTVEEDRRGLFVRGRLTQGVQRSEELERLIDDGAIDGLSIGFRTKLASRDPRSGVRRLQVVELIEVSLVTFPMLKPARLKPIGQLILPQKIFPQPQPKKELTQ